MRNMNLRKVIKLVKQELELKLRLNKFSSQATAGKKAIHFPLIQCLTQRTCYMDKKQWTNTALKAEMTC